MLCKIFIQTPYQPPKESKSKHVFDIALETLVGLELWSTK